MGPGVCVCVCGCVCIYIYIHTHIHVCMLAYVYVYEDVAGESTTCIMHYTSIMCIHAYIHKRMDMNIIDISNEPSWVY